VGTSEFVNICKRDYCFLKIKSLKKLIDVLQQKAALRFMVKWEKKIA